MRVTTLSKWTEMHYRDGTTKFFVISINKGFNVDYEIINLSLKVVLQVAQ